jgi:hypothetical protein
MKGKSMPDLSSARLSVVAAGLLCIGQLMWSTAAQAQQAAGHASAVRASVLGITTVLADTGTLGGSSDAREASQLMGRVSSLLTAETLRATTIGYPDQVDSEASLSGLNLSIAGLGITADAVMARAFAFTGAVDTGLTNISGLNVDGVPVVPSGEPNQIVSFGVLTVVLNEQIPSADGITVNALRIKTLDGSTDIVIGSATAAIASSNSGPGSTFLKKLL